MNSTLKKVLIWTAGIVSVLIVLLIVGGLYLGSFIWTWINNPSNQVGVDSILSQVNTLEQQAEGINLAGIRNLVAQSQQIISNTTGVEQLQGSGLEIMVLSGTTQLQGAEITELQSQLSGALMLIDSYKAQMMSDQDLTLMQLQQLEGLLQGLQTTLAQ